jgi:hypothetical protein
VTDTPAGLDGTRRGAAHVVGSVRVEPLEADVLLAPPSRTHHKRPKISYDAKQADIEVDGVATRRRVTVCKSFVPNKTRASAPLRKLATIDHRPSRPGGHPPSLAMLWRCLQQALRRTYSPGH